MPESKSDRALVIGTRQSKLAVWQAQYIAAALRKLYADLDVSLKFFETHGDRTLDKPLPEIGGKGVFTAELESALLSREIDIAVHSLKDLPTDMDSRFAIAAIPERALPFDVLISRDRQSLAALPRGATVGTSSLRRVAQIKAFRPDLQTQSLRGNVPTRIARAQVADGPYDAIVVAAAGLDRLDMEDAITEILAPEVMLPAPAQGALAVQCLSDDAELLKALAPLDHTQTRLAVTAERSFLNALDSGCRLPVAALAWLDGQSLSLTGRVASLDGSQVITEWKMTPLSGDQGYQAAIRLGADLAQMALAEGAAALLDAVRAEIDG
ncbi:MAG TPA: hydroxymethylbilane synthase [Aggregatilineales bacterium]|nr:hydroxymethylbilane synthase [Aggregatilineales bacterium]